MSDPADHVNALLQAAFSPHFEDRLPEDLGAELFKTARNRLRSEGLFDEDHAHEIISRLITNGLVYLSKHGGQRVHHPRGWLHGICRNEISHYLQELAVYDGGTLIELVEGGVTCGDILIQNPDRVDALLQEALHKLSPRHRELVYLDLVRLLPPAEIERAMGIKSHGYFLKLKCNAFSALRDALKDLI